METRAGLGDVSPEQLRAARELLNWTRADLSKASGVSVDQLRRFEDYGVLMGAMEFARAQSALGDKGVEFIDPGPGGGRGVRLRRQAAQMFGPASIVFGGPLKRRPKA